MCVAHPHATCCEELPQRDLRIHPEQPMSCLGPYKEVKLSEESLDLTAGFLYRAGAETPLNFREKFPVFPRSILENFSGVDTQTAVLVSTAEVWISAPDTQTPIFLGFWVSTADFGFSAGRRKVSDIFLRCLSRKFGSQHQLRIKTLPSWTCLQAQRPKESARAKRDFANVTLLWVKNCQNMKIKLARCLMLGVAGFDQSLWRPSCRETARVSTARVAQGVSPGVPQWGATRGQSFSLRKTQGCQT